MKSKSIKLVLSGSGTRYPCFIGAIKKLLEQGYEIEEVCGTSGGALVAAGLASFYDKQDPLKTVDKLQDFALDILPGPLMDWNLLPFFRRGFIGGKKVLKTLERELPGSFDDTVIPVRVITFNNNLSRHKIWTSEDKGVSLPLTVRASMSLPIIFDLVKIQGDYHSDGGIVGNFELDVFGRNVDNVFGISFTSVEEVTRREIKFKHDIVQSHLDGAIEESMIENIEDMEGSPVCFIETKHSGLNLKMTGQDVLEQIQDGYRSMEKRLLKLDT